MMKRLLSLLGFGARRQPVDRQEMARRREEHRVKVLASFPFEVVETTGAEALAKWQELKGSGRGVPIVVGTELEGIADPFASPQVRPVSDILAAADKIRFPEDFFKYRRDELLATAEYFRKKGQSFDIESEEPPLGEWPAETGRSAGLSVASNILTGELYPKVHIVLVPTEDPTTVPAHLQWGNFNDCGPPEYHVAALRHWRDRYGAELVGMDADTLNIRVARRPTTRDEALELARVQYAYCNDIVDQGLEGIRPLAAELMAHDWWFFWWD